MGNLLAGQDLRQLLCAAGGIFGRDHPQGNALLIGQHGAHHRNCLGFVILNADQHLLRLQNVGEDAHAVDDLRGAVLHQAIVGGDIGLALGGINNQGADFIPAAAQLGTGREARTAQTGHAKLMNALNKRRAAFLLPVAPAVTIDPAIFAVGVEHDAHLRQAGRVGGGMRLNRRDGAGGRSVNRQHSAPAAGERLAAQHPIAGGNAKLAFGTDVLFQRQNVALCQRDLAQRRTV